MTYHTDVMVRVKPNHSQTTISWLTFSYLEDDAMMAYFNGKEHTTTDFRDLLNQAGWKLAGASHDTSLTIRFGKVIAVPN